MGYITIRNTCIMYNVYISHDTKLIYYMPYTYTKTLTYKIQTH